MRVRVAGLYRHPKSKMWWFRMVVPERHRLAAGRREWKYSLGTTDENEARLRHAEKLAEIRRYMAGLDAFAAASIGEQADQVVAKGMVALARANIAHQASFDLHFDMARGIDNVSYGMLKFLSLRVRQSWGGKHAPAAERQCRIMRDTDLEDDRLEFVTDLPPRLGSAFPALDHRKLASAQIEAFEEQPSYQGAAFREIARGLLAARDWKAAAFETQLVANAAGEALPSHGVLFDAVAERVLRRLAEHRFTHWPEDAELVLNPMTAAMAAHLVEQDAPAPQPAVPDAPDRSLGALYKLWRDARRLGDGEARKSADEWLLAVRRFEELIGPKPVTAITSGDIRTFRDQCFNLPARVEKSIKKLPAREQIALAAAKKLPTLSAPSVGKQVAAIKALLAVAKEYEWVPVNVAQGIKVDGARHTGTERDHFNDEEMALIYNSRLMTDPDACSDTMFWILFLAPFHGSRPGEHCQLKPSEIVQDDGDWIMRFRADRRPQRGVDGGTMPVRHLKTLQSQRDVPLHWIVLEGGFLDFVAVQQARRSPWLFDDLKPAKYGDRYTYLSQAINRELRRLGITQTDKAFYSTRHSMKREGRRRRIPEMNLAQAAGHATRNTGEAYGQGVPLDILKADMDRLEFRSVHWDAVVHCARARVDRLRERMR